MWTRKQLFDDGWPVNLAADLQIGCLEHPPDLHVGIKTVFAGKYLQWLFSDLFPILERTNSLLQNRRIFIFIIGVGNKEIVIIIVVINWVWNKGNESLDNYPVDSFFNGPAAFCDSNTRRFILVSVLYQPQTNCASQIGILKPQFPWSHIFHIILCFDIFDNRRRGLLSPKYKMLRQRWCLYWRDNRKWYWAGLDIYWFLGGEFFRSIYLRSDNGTFETKNTKHIHQSSAPEQDVKKSADIFDITLGVARILDQRFQHGFVSRQEKPFSHNIFDQILSV